MAKSLRRAVNAKCRECIYDPLGGGGTWRQQVAACTSPTCSLYPVRPMPAVEKARDGAGKAVFSTLDAPETGETA